ncbi:MAG: anti-sigma factor antagonist [Candidatus Fournierella pullistercoris]|uniref:Anti-sigma factor antagonist n=1 Tax=Candidatus Allofournierella pullistercoris TaxID=2838597 RepID=A0A948WV02_9FIRM|nr:anti-sigma factor antagonist [Candidatus Fournierella pullistercoris]
MARVHFSSSAQVLAAYLSGEIDHHSAQNLRQLIDSEISETMPEQLILDFTDVGFMDSSGVGLILGRAKRMQAVGGSVLVQHAPPSIQKMLQLAHVAYQS